MPAKLTESDFWNKVQRGSQDSCWPYLGAKTKQGYGSTSISGKKSVAHRLAYEFVNGPIPNGMVVMHSCDVRACCNPKHLKLGTQKENLSDMHQKGRAGDCRNFGEAHGRCKVKDVQVAEIRTLYQTTRLSQAALAARFGISQTQVSRIIRGENR